MGDHAAVEEPLIAVLSGRLSYKRVADFVKWTWASAKLTPEEWFDGIRNRKLAYEPHPGVIGTAQWQGEMTCGHNPFVWARLVRNARVEVSGDERSLVWDRWVMDAEVYARQGVAPPEETTSRMLLR